MTTDFRQPEPWKRSPRDEDDPTMGSEDREVTRRFRARDVKSGGIKTRIRNDGDKGLGR
jgi:hypothetical protein